jgi:hydrogenase-4 component E
VTPATTLLAFLGLVVTLLIVWRRSWPGRLRLFVVQSLLLAALALTLGLYAGQTALVLVAAMVAVLKGWFIPRALARIAAGTPVRPVAAGTSASAALLTAGALVVAAYLLMLPVATRSALPTAGAVPLAFAMALIGLFVTVTGRDVFGHALGFLMLENGLFTLALVATYGLPALVEAGVFLDVLVIVLVMEGVATHLRREHDSIEVDRLRELRG